MSFYRTIKLLELSLLNYRLEIAECTRRFLPVTYNCFSLPKLKYTVHCAFYISLCLVYCLKNNRHTIAKVRENANRHGGKNATITKWRQWWQLLNENEKKTFKIQNIKAKCKNTEHFASSHLTLRPVHQRYSRVHLDRSIIKQRKLGFSQRC